MDDDEPDFCGLLPNFLVCTEYNKEIGIPHLGVWSAVTHQPGDGPVLGTTQDVLSNHTH